MQFMVRGLVALFVFSTLAFGQNLRVQSSRASTGSISSMAISLDAPPGKAPSTMQWEMTFPPAIVVNAMDISAGEAAEADGKAITCAKTDAKTEVKNGVKLACVLAGGRKAIRNGPIAVIHFRLQTDVGGAPVRVPIENIVGVAVDLKRIPIPNIDAIIVTQ
jgi:hypothetical protein